MMDGVLCGERKSVVYVWTVGRLDFSLNFEPWERRVVSTNQKVVHSRGPPSKIAKVRSAFLRLSDHRSLWIMLLPFLLFDGYGLGIAQERDPEDVLSQIYGAAVQDIKRSHLSRS